MRKTLATIGLSAAMLTLPVQAVAQSGPQCLTPSQAEALMVTLLPDVIGSLANVCNTALPASARLLNSQQVIENSYRPAAQAASAEGTAAFMHMMGDKDEAVSPELLKALAPMLIGEAITSEVKPADCTTIDDLYSALEPLPPQNMARLLIALVKLGGKDESNQFLCPTAE